MSTERRYLVIRADRTMRVVTRLPRLDNDEIAMRLNVKFPDGWGRVVHDIDIEVPDLVPSVERVEPTEEG